MMHKKRVQSKALNLLDNRMSMAKPVFVEEKLRQLEQKGIKINWLRPKDQVMEQLIEALPKIGVNKWVVDQAAKEIYGRMEIGIGEKGTQRIDVMGHGSGRLTKGQQQRHDERVLSPANRERRDRQSFLRMKNRLGPKVANEVVNSLYKLNMREEEFIQLVKLTWSFREWAKKSNPHEAETMALEIARDIKRREMWKRNLHERIRAP
jgi:hypothetical protein